MVHNPDHPQGFWKMAKVQRLITRRDGQTRGVVLRSTTKGGKLATLQKPVQLIYPLGVAQSETVEDTEEPQNLRKKEMNPNLPYVHSETLP